MAVTWSVVPITPAGRHAGMPRAEHELEASSQTEGIGAPVVINASGVLGVIASNGTLISGITAKAQQNGATDGAKRGVIYRAGPLERFTGTFIVTSWNQTMIGSAVAFSKVSSTYVLVSATALSASAQCKILGAANNDIAAGDVNVPIIFSVLNANVQGEV